MKKRNLRKFVLLCALLFVAGVVFASGQTESTNDVYPSKEVSVIVIANAGGGTDSMARAVTVPLEAMLKKPFVVINNGSAGGLIASEDISQADSDGYTLGVFSNTDVANFAYTMEDCMFTVDDFTYIAGLNTTGDVIILKKGSQFNGLEDFLSYAKANPGKLTVGLPSPIQNMSLTLFENGTGADVTGVVYEGGNKLFADLLGGHVDAAILSAKFIKQAADNNLAVLGLMLDQRLSSYPDVPTFAEQGYEIVNPAVRMLVGPKGISEEVVGKLQETLKAGFEADMKKNIETIGEVPNLLVSDELDAFLKSDFEMRKAYYESL